MKDKVLIVVGYYGGYGGSFFANVLRKSLCKDTSEIIPINNRNEFTFETDVLGPERYSLDPVMKAYDKGLKNMFNVQFFDGKSAEKEHWIKTFKNVLNECYNDDRSIFIDNLIMYYQKRLNLKTGFNVTNMHYSKPYDGFSIHRVYDNTVYLLLNTNSHKHHLLFDLILDIKQNHFRYHEFIKKSLEFLSNPYNPSYIKQSFDSCHLIDAGKLFLEVNENYIFETQHIIQKALNYNLTIDKDMILDYSKSNLMVLDDFLSIDCNKSSFLEVIRAVKKKLESLL